MTNQHGGIGQGAGREALLGRTPLQFCALSSMGRPYEKATTELDKVPPERRTLHATRKGHRREVTGRFIAK